MRGAFRACGAASPITLVDVVARSRQMVSAPGRFVSQAANVSEERVRPHVHDPAGIDVDQDSAVGTALAFIVPDPSGKTCGGRWG